MLDTGADLIIDRQHTCITALSAMDDYIQVEATSGWGQHPYAGHDGALMESMRAGLPAALAELTTLGRTLVKRAADVFVYIDRPGTSDGSPETINGPLGRVRGTAMELLNFTHQMPAASLGLAAANLNYTLDCAEF